MAEQHVFGVKVSLTGITDNEDIEKDTRFLDELRKMFDSFETSLSSLLLVNKLKRLIKMLGEL